MYPTIPKIRIAALAVAAFMVAPVGEAMSRDYKVCYRATGLGTTRIVLNVAKHSDLPTWRAGQQSVYEADGKHTLYRSKNRSVMATVDGSIVTSRGGGGQVAGSHFGGISLFVRGGRGFGPKGGPSHPIYWECTSPRNSPVPPVWYCTIKSDSYKRNLGVTLIKLRRPDRHCDIFQDTR